MGSVTSSPRPGDSGSYPAKRPDSTDPDLAPVPALAETGHLPPYPRSDGYEETVAIDEEVDDAGDPEAVEDGLQGSREPGAAAVAARLSRRPRDMVISIGVLLLVIFSLFGLYRWLGGGEANRADTAAAFAEARTTGKIAVAEPSGLDAKWVPVSADFQPQDPGGVVRVGWQTPDDGAIQLIEGNVSPDGMLARELGDNARVTGMVDIDGRSWQLYEARKGERAYVLLEPGRTIIVVGKAKEAEFRTFVSSLKLT
jgi:uncharacterized protein DUF4245